MGSFKSAEKSKHRGGLLGKIDAPLDKKLQAVKWGKFRLGDLFEQYRGKEKAPNQCEDGDCPLINETSTNNGFTRKVKPTKIFKGNAITISINYASTVFYQKNDFCASVNISILKNDEILRSKETAMFFISLIKLANVKYNYALKISKDKINDTIIQLPITSSGEIDFDFMESFIREIEAERMRELDAYLQTTGLKDYALTVAEQKVLEEFEHVKWGKFRLGDLFEKIKVNSLKYKTSTLPNIAEKEYDLPALTAGIQNQGLNNYVPRENATVLKNVISISANGANTGATFYQSKEFTVLQDAYAIRWMYSDKILTDDQSLFLVSAISKSIYGSYEWTNKAGWERIKNDTIQLPLTPTGEIDFDFMETFIKAIEKLVIKDVVQYTDKRVAATAQMVK